MIKRIPIILILIIFILNTLFAKNNIYYESKVQELRKKTNSFNYSERDSLIYYANLTIQTARDSKDKIIERDALYVIGLDFTKVGILDSAQILLEEALKLSEELKDQTSVGKAKNQLGHLYWLMSKHMKAKIHFEDAIEIHKRLNNHRELGKAYNNLANLYTRWGDYNKAINLFLKALDSYVESEFTEGVAWLHFSMGLLYKRVGEYDQALNYMLNSLKSYEKIAINSLDSTGIRLCFTQLGYLYSHHFDSLDLGLNYQLEALRLAEKGGINIAIADALGGVGQTYYKMGKLELAKEYIQRAYDYRVQAGMKSGTGSNLKFLGYIEKDKGNYQKAEEYYDRAIVIAKELNYSNIINDLNYAYSEIYELQEKYDKSLYFLQRYISMKDSILSNEIANKVASTHLKYEIETKTRENDILSQQNEIQQLQISRGKLLRNFLIVLVFIALVVIFTTIVLYLKQRQIKTLKGLVPICASCKSIRNDKGYYEKLEKYISDHTEANFSHDLCPDCIKKLEPELYQIMKDNGSI